MRRKPLLVRPSVVHGIKLYSVQRSKRRARLLEPTEVMARKFKSHYRSRVREFKKSMPKSRMGYEDEIRRREREAKKINRLLKKARERSRRRSRS